MTVVLGLLIILAITFVVEPTVRRFEARRLIKQRDKKNERQNENRHHEN